jgi:hypothetical protein
MSSREVIVVCLFSLFLTKSDRLGKHKIEIYSLDFGPNRVLVGSALCGDIFPELFYYPGSLEQ